MPWTVILWTIGIFVARLVDVSLGTIRVRLIIHRRKLLAALVSFVEIVIFILIVSKVIQEIAEHWYYVIAYAGGFAVGTVVGIWLSERMARGAMQVTVIPHGPWEEVEAAVRKAGFALTRHSGVGREGHVAVLTAICSEQVLPRLVGVVAQTDPRAFVYTQELTNLRGGYVYGLKGKL